MNALFIFKTLKFVYTLQIVYGIYKQCFCKRCSVYVSISDRLERLQNRLQIVYKSFSGSIYGVYNFIYKSFTNHLAVRLARLQNHLQIIYKSFTNHLAVRDFMFRHSNWALYVGAAATNRYKLLCYILDQSAEAL